LNAEPESDPPTLEESIRHKLLLVTKFLHEAQHLATAKYLALDRVVSALIVLQEGSVSSDGKLRHKKPKIGYGAAAFGEAGAAIEEGGASCSPAQCTRSSKFHSGMSMSATPVAHVTPPSSQVKALQLTPEALGYTLENGIGRGDSGHALEELIFGGRLKHRHMCASHTDHFQECNYHFYSVRGIFANQPQ
jgi:hypothetical protein